MRFDKWTSSLRKRMRVKKSTRSKKSARFSPFTRAVGAGVACLVVMGAAIVAITESGSRPAVPARPQIAQAAPAQMPAADAAAAQPPAAEAPADSLKTPEAKSPIVTITGCLERDDESFRLRDTTGVDAPKARSWKSGFLKKSPATVAVVDGANRAKLPAHVGQRVSVTGVLVDREMQVRSLQRIAASCGGKIRA